MNRKLLFLPCVLIFTSFAAVANTTNTGEENVRECTRKSDLNGSVVHSETKTPIREVVVSAYYSNKKEKVVVTDMNGSYVFYDLKPGLYKFVFERQGYKKVTREKVLVKPEEGFQLNISMNEEEDFNWIPGSFHFSADN